MRAMVMIVAGLATGASGQISASYTQPTFDRWNYPFNVTVPAGSEPAASSFGSGFIPGQFDDRDGQFLTSWVTAADIAPGLGAANYVITRAVMTATTLPNDADLIAYDPTLDATETYREPFQPGFIPDSDAGRPVELFGTGFRNGFNAFAYGEAGPWGFASPLDEGVRNAYAAGFDAGGALVDVSNSVRDGFTPVPFAIGTLDGVAPGEPVPASALFSFHLDVGNPLVQAYLASSLDSGILSLSIASLHPAAQPGGPPMVTYPRFRTKESPFGSAPTLLLEVTIIPAPGVGGLGLVAAGLAARRRR